MKLKPIRKKEIDPDQRVITLFNSMNDPAMEVDSEGVIKLYNGALLALLNTNQSLAGLKIDDVVELFTQGKTKVLFSELVGDGKSAVNRDDLLTGNESIGEINLSLSISPIRVSNVGTTTTTGFIIVLRDITAQRAMDEERDEFIAVASHELRTPIAIAEANLSTVMLPGYTKLDAKASGLIDIAHDNLVYLGELIRDMTSLAMAQRIDLPIELTLVNISKMLNKLRQDYHEEATNNGLKLVVKSTPGHSVSVLTAEEETREILQNFISNAIKYTDKGTVTLSVEREGSDGIRIDVTDTGHGISSIDKRHLFDKFFRSEDTRIRKTSGTGLGLYIAKKLTARLEGKIELTSKLNSGSTFTLLLPHRAID